MERAHQQQVVQVGPASLLPSHDVMGLGESARPAPRKPAFQSLYLSWRIIQAEGSLAIRPSRIGVPEASSSTVWTRPMQSGRLTVSGWTTPPPSTSQPPLPETRLSS